MHLSSLCGWMYIHDHSCSARASFSAFPSSHREAKGSAHLFVIGGIIASSQWAGCLCVVMQPSSNPPQPRTHVIHRQPCFLIVLGRY